MARGRTIFRWILFAPAAAIVGLYGYALTLPETWELEVARKIDAPASQLYDRLSDLRTWPSFLTWATQAGVKHETWGEPGERQRLGLSGPRLGDVELAIVRLQEDRRVSHRLRIGQLPQASGTLKLSEEDGATWVEWSLSGAYGAHLLTRLFGQELQRAVRDDLSRSLDRLAATSTAATSTAAR